MQKTFIYFSYVMIAVFIGGGIYVMVAPPPLLADPIWARFLAGAIFILYAVFRWQRIRYMKRRYGKDDEQ